jgi:hypothetical protein
MCALLGDRGCLEGSGEVVAGAVDQDRTVAGGAVLRRLWPLVARSGVALLGHLRLAADSTELLPGCGRPIGVTAHRRMGRAGGIAMMIGMLLVVSSCGSTLPSNVSGGGTSPPVSSSAPSPARSLGPTDQTTVSGVIIEGLRPTCRVLQTDRRRYALVGPATQELSQGQRVTVTGHERPDLLNPCGLTFVVSTIR